RVVHLERLGEVRLGDEFRCGGDVERAPLTRPPARVEDHESDSRVEGDVAGMPRPGFGGPYEQLEPPSGEPDGRCPRHSPGVRRREGEVRVAVDELMRDALRFRGRAARSHSATLAERSLAPTARYALDMRNAPR